jgi:hypothetical protein
LCIADHLRDEMHARKMIHVRNTRFCGTFGDFLDGFTHSASAAMALL